MKVGFIFFANTAPYYHYWPKDQFPTLLGAPRQLAEAARSGDLMAAPLPLTSCWDLEDIFEPLGGLGIAVKQESRSVFLLSRKPLAELGSATIGLTMDSNASVRLLQVLLSQKYNVVPTLKRGFSDDDDAWLVIGDQALGYWQASSPVWPHVLDLASEWWDWQKRPFVFARWMVNRKLTESDKNRLALTVGQSLEQGLANLPLLSQNLKPALKLSAEKIEVYLRGFTYRFSKEEENAEQHFRLMVNALQWPEAVTVK
jgi:chorismate dehydratase